MAEKTCKKCEVAKPMTIEFFNMLPSGNYRGTCKSCMAANTQSHYYKNPKKVAARVRAYNLKKSQSQGSYNSDDIELLRKDQEDRCYYCDEELHGSGEIDHKIPISKNGTNLPDNLALSCRTCNRDKHNKTSDEYFTWRENKNLHIGEYGVYRDL